MNFAGNFRHIGNVDPAPLAALTETLSEAQWAANTFRQQKYEVHRDTQTIGLVFDPDFRHTHPTRLPLLEKFVQDLRPVLALVADYYESGADAAALIDSNGLGYFIRATLVRLAPGGTIAAHTDNNFSLTHSHRVHVPLITNDAVWFQVGSDRRSLRAGEVWEINNRRMHSVGNDGDAARVHLILDYVLPGEQCCCGRKLHPDTVCSPQACMATDHLQVACNCHPE
jgi:quercetin dioxygenase-like cupin family protein